MSTLEHKLFVIAIDKHLRLNGIQEADLPTYLDNNATTPLDPRVKEALFQAFELEYGNSGSRTHEFGQSAKRAVESARQQIAQVVSAVPQEVVFTSGATEASNLAILGLETYGRSQGRKHIVSTSIEHKAVLEPLEVLQSRGFEVTYVPVSSSGRVDAGAVINAVRDDTLLVSVMHANNETGIIQPVTEIADGLPETPFFHVDAAQTFGKIIPPLQHPRLDLISISGHKIYGPKGIGALIARRRSYNSLPLTPLLFGGGQERGLRPGTLPVPLIVGFGVAAQIAQSDHVEREAICREIKNAASTEFARLNAVVVGDAEWAMPNVLSVAFPGVDSEALMLATREFAAMSNGSACTSSSYSRSHVLQAMGMDEEVVDGAVRLSWSHMTGSVPWAELASLIGDIAGNEGLFRQ